MVVNWNFILTKSKLVVTYIPFCNRFMPVFQIFAKFVELTTTAMF